MFGDGWVEGSCSAPRFGASWLPSSSAVSSSAKQARPGAAGSATGQNRRRPGAIYQQIGTAQGFFLVQALVTVSQGASAGA